MKKFVPGVVAGLAAAALLAAPAYAGPTVTVRVEGDASTLLERTQVTLPDTGNDLCGGAVNTVAQALDIATGGNWDRQPFASTILAESHTFTDSDYWALWNGVGGDYSFSAVGICDRVMAPGEEALFLVDRTGPAPDFLSSAFPLALRGLPSAVQVGVPVTVSVVRFAVDGAASPVAGATVSGGGASATTDAAGRAVLTFPNLGAARVKASAGGLVVSAGEAVTVSATPVPPGPGGTGTGGTASGPDTTAPVARIAGLKKEFARGRGPRELHGTVSADPSGIKSVRLAISRKRGDRCWSFAGGRERFVAHRCGGWKSFRIGDRQDWSYLLPQRLGSGRYTIRVVAIDKRGNDAATVTRIRVR